MSDYHRIFLKGGTYFFTIVTNNRLPIFKEVENIELLNQCFRNAIEKSPFTIVAIVILPDHLHTIWTLPKGESDYSTRWKLIKGSFSHRYSGQIITNISKSMLKKNEKGIWQRRFWEHTLRDQEDFNRHCDYIHYNPVKHKFVISPIEWKYSSFRNMVKAGYYPEDWGGPENKEFINMDCE